MIDKSQIPRPQQSHDVVVQYPVLEGDHGVVENIGQGPETPRRHERLPPLGLQLHLNAVPALPSQDGHDDKIPGQNGR